MDRRYDEYGRRGADGRNRPRADQGRAHHPWQDDAWGYGQTQMSDWEQAQYISNRRAEAQARIEAQAQIEAQNRAEARARVEARVRARAKLRAQAKEQALLDGEDDGQYQVEDKASGRERARARQDAMADATADATADGKAASGVGAGVKQKAKARAQAWARSKDGARPQAPQTRRLGANQGQQDDENQEYSKRQPVSKLIRDKVGLPLWSMAIIGASALFMVVVGIVSIQGPGDGGTKPQQDSYLDAEMEMLASGDADDEEVSEQPVPQGLSQRDEDFAVDPNRVTEWNYDGNGRKVVYLTIDDGPSKNTEKVLDILDKYDCKATFFVVGQDPAHYDMIGEAYKRGHTIGMHTFSHDYAAVYASVDAYYQDLDQIAQVVEDQIGYVPCFIRFPGGSSNTISANYCPGIMSTLAPSVQEQGYQYYDWNMSSGDGEVHTADELVAFATEPTDMDNIVLLCHDAEAKGTTVEALPRIIEHYQSLGYTFEAIDRTTLVPHHSINN